jgi:hypothetical protein
MNSKNKNVRDLYTGTNELKRSYQPRNNLVKDENGDLLADSHYMNYFSQLLNVRCVSDVRQIDIHAAEPLVPGPSPSELEVATANTTSYKQPSSDQVPVELIQAGDETLWSEDPKLHYIPNSIWIKEKLPNRWKESSIVPIYKQDDTSK